MLPAKSIECCVLVRHYSHIPISWELNQMLDTAAGNWISHFTIFLFDRKYIHFKCKLDYHFHSITTCIFSASLKVCRILHIYQQTTIKDRRRPLMCSHIITSHSICIRNMVSNWWGGDCIRSYTIRIRTDKSTERINEAVKWQNRLCSVEWNTYKSNSSTVIYFILFSPSMQPI